MEENIQQIYKRPYLILFTHISWALEAMEELDFGEAKRILMEGQSNAEEAYLEATDHLEEE